MVTANCPWWARWYHRRLRKIDREVLFDSINDQAPTPGQATRAREYFKALQGQDHWRCPCAIREEES